MIADQLSASVAEAGPHVAAVALIAARLLPVALLCPLLGGSLAPSTVKLGLVLSFSLCLHFAGGVQPAESCLTVVALAALAGKELIVGLALGLVASAPFDAARVGGRLIDLFRGSSAEAALPQAGTRESATGDGLYQLTVSLACSGVAMPIVLAALFRSFTLIKLGGFVTTELAAMHVVSLTSTAFATGLAIGAPVAGVSLAVDAVFGFVSRAVPQLNLQDTGAPLKILAGGAALWLTIGMVSERLLTEMTHLESSVRTLGELAL